MEKFSGRLVLALDAVPGRVTIECQEKQTSLVVLRDVFSGYLQIVVGQEHD